MERVNIPTLQWSRWHPLATILHAHDCQRLPPFVISNVQQISPEESFKKYGLDSAGRLPQSKLADLFESIYPDPRPWQIHTDPWAAKSTKRWALTRYIKYDKMIRIPYTCCKCPQVGDTAGWFGVVPIQKSEKTIKVSQTKYHKRGPAVSALLSLNPAHPVVEWVLEGSSTSPSVRPQRLWSGILHWKTPCGYLAFPDRLRELSGYQQACRYHIHIYTYPLVIWRGYGELNHHKSSVNRPLSIAMLNNRGGVPT